MINALLFIINHYNFSLIGVSMDNYDSLPLICLRHITEVGAFDL